MADNIFLFSNNNGGIAEDFGNYKIFDMKIEGNAQENVDGVNYVTSLIGDGASYINTGIAVKTGYKIEVSFTTLTSSYSSYNCIYGAASPCGYSYDTMGGTTLAASGKYIRARDNGSGGGSYIYLNLSVIPDKYYTVNRTLINVSNANYVYLFANNCGNTVNDYCSNQILMHDYKVYDTDDNLLIHLRPCLDSSGTPCMYDDVSKKYFYNRGKGTFTYIKTLRDFQAVLDKNQIPCLMDKENRKFYYNKGTGQFGTKEQYEYKRVSYIKGDGASYIDTGIIPTTNAKIELVADMDFTTNGTIFGSSTFMYCRFQATSKWLYARKRGTNDLSIGTGYYEFKGKHTFVMDLTDTTNTITIDGINWENTIGSASTGTTSMLLLAGLNGNGGMYDIGVGKIYSCKLWDGDTLVFDGVPALDLENTPCLYDNVTKTYFYNQGTGTFTYAIEEETCPEVDYVEYLQSNGNGEYIDTGMVYNSQYKYILKYSFDNYESTYAFGVTENNGDRGFSYNLTTDGLIYNNYITSSTYPGIRSNTKSNTQKLTFDNGSVYLDDVLMGEYSSSTDVYTSSNNIYLFKSNGNTTPSTNVKFYYYQVYNGEELVQDLKPCLDSNGVACMYDSVSKSYFYNETDTTFTNGNMNEYEVIQYIQSSGKEYIDTGIQMDDSLEININCRECNKYYTEVEYLLGDGNSYIDTGMTTTEMANGSYTIEIKRNDPNDSSLSSQAVFGVVDANNITNSTLFGEYYNYGYFSKGGMSSFKDIETTSDKIVTTKMVVNTDTSSNVGANSGANVYLFAWNGYNNSNTAIKMNNIIKIYYYKVYNSSDELIMHLIPCIDTNNEYCMYDVVNDVFYYNQGSGRFSIGAILGKNYLMNNLYTKNTYKYNDVDTNTQSNLIVSEGNTLTMGDYIDFLDEYEIDLAVKDGWNLL